MIDSLFLESYGPLIIPTNLILGFLMTQKSVIFKKINIVGFFLLFSGLLVYYERLTDTISNSNDKSILPVFMSLFYVFYLFSLIFEIDNRENLMYVCYFMISSSLLVIGWILGDNEIFSQKSQYIYLTIIGLIFIFTYYLPKYRKEGEIFSFTLSFMSLFLIVLIYVSIKTPE
jgi:hypothetical protein